MYRVTCIVHRHFNDKTTIFHIIKIVLTLHLRSIQFILYFEEDVLKIKSLFRNLFIMTFPLKLGSYLVQ